MNLVIHIGSHWAGSSAIQKYFSSNNELLAKQGISYPNGLFPRYPDQHSELVRLAQSKPEEQLGELAEAIARRSELQGAKYTLMSGEDLCAQARLEDAQRIFAAFSKWFSPIRIAFVLRNRRDHLLSHFSHYLRHATSAVGPQDIARHLQFNPAAAAERWGKAFGADSVSIIPYSSNDSLSLLGRFCRTLFGHIPPPEAERALAATNPPFDMISALVINEAAKQRPDLGMDAIAHAYGFSFRGGAPRLPRTEDFIATMLLALVDGDGWDIAPQYSAEAGPALDEEAARRFIDGLEGFLSRLKTARDDGGFELTKDFIVQAYRTMLDREPESSFVVEQALGYGSRTNLRLAMISSPEFRQRNPQKEHVNTVPLDAVANHVEHDVDAGRLGRLFAHIQSKWTKLGQERPHWSVLSSDNYAGAVTPELDEQFFRTGVQERAVVEAILARANRSMGERMRAVEYGCGIGRLSLQFAAMFDAVTAIDISPSHLELARRKAAERGLTNLRFVLADVAEFGMSGPFDFWYSRIVLQHNPPPLMAAILRRALSLLSPGGAAVFQIPTYAVGYSFRIDQYLQSMGEGGDIEMHCLPQSRIFQIVSEMGCRVLEVREDDAVDIPRYWVSNTFVVEKPRTQGLDPGPAG